jgi:diguanylate cyclase (GGDEF)-like protein
VKKPIKVLLVEDDAGDMLLTKRMLTERDAESFDLTWADSLSKAIGHSVEGKFDVVLSDLNLPDSSGLETFLKLKLYLPGVPIVVMSGFGGEKEYLEAVREGAQDYIIKGQTNHDLLTRSLRYAIERKNAEDTVIKMAYHDSLTGLPSRSLFADRGEMAIAECKRNHTKVAFLMLDLDHFKGINDRLGHEAGDELLKESSKRLESTLRQTDTICRMGGDEFALLISDVISKETLTTVAMRIMDILNTPFTLHGLTEKLTASLGIAIYPEDGKSLKTLLKHADVAMYEVKRKGRNDYLYYQSAMKTSSSV